MASSPKVILCTGANQGLGFEIVNVAAVRDPTAVYLLTCRNKASGDEALQKLRELGVTAEIEVLQLDITNDEHILAAVKHVETKYGKLDVLINNAGIVVHPKSDASLSELRGVYNTVLNTNTTSVAVLTTAFIPLLHRATHPKVINVGSGLGSITNTLTKKMGRTPPYGTSKVAVNGMTAHFQTAENDRVALGGDAAKAPKINYYVCQPGALKTAFTKSVLAEWFPHAQENAKKIYDGLRDPKEGAEVVVRLATEDSYECGTYWEFVDGEMKTVPW